MLFRPLYGPRFRRLEQARKIIGRQFDSPGRRHPKLPVHGVQLVTPEEPEHSPFRELSLMES